MRFLHMADAHYGRRFSSSRFGPAAAAARREALEDALKQLVRYANENGVDCILCAGDLIESAEIRPADLMRLDDILSGLVRAKFIAVAGNHDPMNTPSPALRLKAAALTLLPSGYSRTMLDGTTALHAFSFPEAVVRENPLAHAALDLSAPRNILLMHCDAISPESDYLPVRMDFLNRFDYCALGHVHKPLFLAPNAAYCGSLIGLDRNETGPRGFVLVDLGAAAPRFVPLPIPTYEKIAVRLTEDMGGVAAEAAVRDALAPLPGENLYSVTLTGVHAPAARPDPDQIAGRLRDSGFMVALTDETRPAWDLAALAAEHRDDLIGRVVAGFGPEEDLSDRDRLALDYAITALMEGGRS